MGNALKLAVLLTGLAALVFLPFSISWNLVVLPAYRAHGLETNARLVEVVPASLPHVRMDTLVVSHRSGPDGKKYRNWLRSEAASRLLEQHKVGDMVPVIYLPDEPDGRAVLAADYDFSQQAPLEDPRFAGGSLALFGLSLALFFAWRRRQLG